MQLLCDPEKKQIISDLIDNMCVISKKKDAGQI